MQQKKVRCPRCKTPQPFGAKCVSCGLDFHEYARKLREKKAAEAGEAKPPRIVKCPLCNKRQPLGAKCVNCGLDFLDYARRLKEKRKAQEEREAEAPAEEPRPTEPQELGEEPIAIALPTLPVEPSMSSVGDLLGNTWLIYKGRFLMLLGLYLLAVAAFIVPVAALTFVGTVMAASMPEAGQAVAFGAGMLGGLLGMVASIGAFGGFISASCDETQKFSEALRSGWRNLWFLLWLYLVAGYIITGGFLLFILPGIAFTVWFFASQFIVFEEREKGMDAMLKSRAYVRGHWWGVFWRLVVISVLGMVVSIVPVVGGLLFTPFMMIFMAHIYKDLRSMKGRDVEYTASAGAKAKWLALATAGYALPVAAAVLLFGLTSLSALKGVDFSSITKFVERGPQVRALKETYARGEPVEVEFWGLPGNHRDRISLVKEGAPEIADGDWFFTSGDKAGRHVFRGLPPGDYEVRVHLDWPRGGYFVKARDGFTVSDEAWGGVRSREAPPRADFEPELWLDRVSYTTGERMVVHFRASYSYAPSAWVGIVPSDISHGSEARNDEHDIARRRLNGRTSGDLVFAAPAEPGIYDLRMHDTDDGGSEVASFTFAVESKPVKR